MGRPVEPRRGRLGLTGRTALASVLLAALVAAGFTLLAVAVRDLRHTASRARHSRQVIATASLSEKLTLDLETGQRGYVITRDRAFLEPWVVARRRLPATQATLVRLVADNPLQAARAREIDAAQRAYLRAYSVPLVQAVDRGGGTAKALVATGKGKRRIDAIRRAFATFVGEENRLATARDRKAGREGRRALRLGLGGLGVSALLILAFAIYLAQTITRPVRRLADVTRRLTAGDFEARVERDAAAELGDLSAGFNQMAGSLGREDWLKSSFARASAGLQGQRTVEAAMAASLAALVELTGAQRGIAFVTDSSRTGGDRVLRPAAAEGFATGEAERSFAFGEGLPGRVAAEGRPLWVDAPAGYAKVESGVGSAPPAELGLVPIRHDDETIAVIELAAFAPFPPRSRELVERFADSAGPALATILASMRTEELLEESQRQSEELQAQSEELQAQSEELRATNEELQHHAESLQASEEQLMAQQEELRQAYEELQLGAARLTETSRFKSEFLANMSHELRTPLNSLLILARILADNAEGNLSADQVKFAETVHGAGRDLLRLINDLLDLSKIEAGRLEVDLREVDLVELSGWAERFGRPLADQKSLAFWIEVVPSTPAPLADEQRLQQVLANLLGNAFKFTAAGTVALRVAGEPDGRVAFAVSDTGIGIDESLHDVVFQAFRQGDGRTSREYGGTGLGLSISRELATLLGGDLSVESEAGKGATFTLRLPSAHQAPTDGTSPPRLDRRLLVVHGESSLGVDLAALLERRGVTVTTATTTDRALELTAENSFDCITVELGFDGGHGAQLLAELELRGVVPATPAIVHTANELSREEERALRRLAASIVVEEEASIERLLAETMLLLEHPQPPAAAPAGAGEGSGGNGFLRGKKILVVDDDVRNVFALTSLLEAHGAHVPYAETGDEALERLEEQPDVDLVLMEVMMPGMDGLDATRAIRATAGLASLPVITLTAKAMPGDRDRSIAAGASDYITKPVENEQLLSLLRVWLHGR